MAVDPEKKKVVFSSWGTLGGASAALLIALAEPHEQASKGLRAPERFPFTKSSKLAGALELESGETLRRRVYRCRRAITRLAEKGGDEPLALDAVVESSQWHGYRLNPFVVRLLSLEELC